MSGFSQILFCGMLGLVASWGSIVLTLRLVSRFKPCRPDEFHHGQREEVSRLGGISLTAAFAAVMVLCAVIADEPLTMDCVCVAVSALLMFLLGLWDDLRALGARRKLLAQLAIASAAYFWGLGIYHFKVPLTGDIIDLGMWSWPVTVVWLVSMTNLINLIDGVDGLAGGISLMLMVLMAAVGGATGHVTLVAAGMVGALLAFLRFNFPPARIYMGDGGAYFLGYLIGALTIVSSNKGTVVAALIAPLFVLALPILDTSLAIIRRGLHGLPLFRADRQHIHHRLLESGWTRRMVVLAVYVFTAFFLILGFAAYWWRGQHVSLVVGSGALVILLAAGRIKFTREWFAVGRVLGNSLHTRVEIHYALAQTRWLALEGARCESLADLCEDLVFVARKLGFASVRLRLEDGEKVWQLKPCKGCPEGRQQLEVHPEICRSRHELPGNRYCFLEVTAPCKRCGVNQSANPRVITEGTFKILSDLLAEGWAKSLNDWQRQYRLPARFDGLQTPAPEKQPAKTSVLEPATA